MTSIQETGMRLSPEAYIRVNVGQLRPFLFPQSERRGGKVTQALAPVRDLAVANRVDIGAFAIFAQLAVQPQISGEGEARAITGFSVLDRQDRRAGALAQIAGAIVRMPADETIQSEYPISEQAPDGQKALALEPNLAQALRDAFPLEVAENAEELARRTQVVRELVKNGTLVGKSPEDQALLIQEAVVGIVPAEATAADAPAAASAPEAAVAAPAAPAAEDDAAPAEAAPAADAAAEVQADAAPEAAAAEATDLPVEETPAEQAVDASAPEPVSAPTEAPAAPETVATTQSKIDAFFQDRQDFNGVSEAEIIEQYHNIRYVLDHTPEGSEQRTNLEAQSAKITAEWNGRGKSEEIWQAKIDENVTVEAAPAPDAPVPAVAAADATTNGAPAEEDLRESHEAPLTPYEDEAWKDIKTLLNGLDSPVATLVGYDVLRGETKNIKANRLAGILQGVFAGGRADFPVTADDLFDPIAAPPGEDVSKINSLLRGFKDLQEDVQVEVEDGLATFTLPGGEYARITIDMKVSSGDRIGYERRNNASEMYQAEAAQALDAIEQGDIRPLIDLSLFQGEIRTLKNEQIRIVCARIAELAFQKGEVPNPTQLALVQALSAGRAERIPRISGQNVSDAANSAWREAREVLALWSTNQEDTAVALATALTAAPHLEDVQYKDDTTRLQIAKQQLTEYMAYAFRAGKLNETLRDGVLLQKVVPLQDAVRKFQETSKTQARKDDGFFTRVTGGIGGRRGASSSEPAITESQRKALLRKNGNMAIQQAIVVLKDGEIPDRKLNVVRNAIVTLVGDPMFGQVLVDVPDNSPGIASARRIISEKFAGETLVGKSVRAMLELQAKGKSGTALTLPDNIVVGNASDVLISAIKQASTSPEALQAIENEILGLEPKEVFLLVGSLELGISHDTKKKK